MGVADGATHSKMDSVESIEGSLRNGAEIFVLFLCSVLMVLRSSVLTVLELLGQISK